MPSHREERHLPYSREKMFDLVADIASYPEFLPWCVGARVHRREGAVVYADVMVGFKMVREKFGSRVTLSRPDRIDVDYLDGPFRYLKNRWVFRESGEGCVVDFFIDFEFRSAVLRRLIQPLFHEAVRRMVAAFEARARALYGSPAGAATPRPA